MAPQTPSEDTPRPARRGSYAKGEARREAILRGVIALFTKEGYNRQSLREIGKSLGLEPAHILYYFANREELLQSVIELWDHDSIAELTQTDRPPAEPSLDLFLRAVGRNVATPGMGHLFLAFAAEAVTPEHSAHTFFTRRVDNVRADLARAIRLGQKAGKIACQVEPERTARYLMALADGLQLQSLLHGRDDVIADLKAAIDALGET